MFACVHRVYWFVHGVRVYWFVHLCARVWGSFTVAKGPRVSAASPYSARRPGPRRRLASSPTSDRESTAERGVRSNPAVIPDSTFLTLSSDQERGKTREEEGEGGAAGGCPVFRAWRQSRVTTQLPLDDRGCPVFRAWRQSCVTTQLPLDDRGCPVFRVALGAPPRPWGCITRSHNALNAGTSVSLRDAALGAPPRLPLNLLQGKEEVLNPKPQKLLQGKWHPA